MDKHQALRELPFAALAGVLEFDLTKFRTRKNDTEWTGPCPIHRPKKNSSSFSYAQDGRFQCFSCGEKGRGAIDLTKAVKNYGFREAVEFLEALRRSESFSEAVERTKAPLGPSLDELPAQNEPKRFTYEKYRVDSPWLANRGLTTETLDRFGVFQYDNPTRASRYRGKVLIRVQRFSDGATVAYLARDIRSTEERGSDPKYVWPAGFHRSLELFGAWQLNGNNGHRHRIIYLVESPFCVMKFHQLGLPAVSQFGWAVSPQQAAIIRQLAKGVVFLPDADKRKEAAQYAGLLSKSVWVRMPEFEAEDPEALSPEQIKALA